jgi:RNA polymerase sigma factor (sigma-70 family)
MSRRNQSVSEAPRREKNWVLNADSFDRFLQGLNPNREIAGEEYEHLRKVLVNFFDWRGCAFPEDLADETFNRVARRIDEGEEIRNLPDYCYGVARRLALEVLPKQSKQEDDPPEFEHLSAPTEDLDERRSREEMYECFEYCLNQLTPENRELVIQYYQTEKRAKIDNRIALANKLGVSLNVLRVRVYRLRASLEDCINKRMQEKADQQAKARKARLKKS